MSNMDMEFKVLPMETITWDTIKTGSLTEGVSILGRMVLGIVESFRAELGKGKDNGRVKMEINIRVTTALTEKTDMVSSDGGMAIHTRESFVRI